MKFSCARHELVEALSNVQRAVSSKSTIAALEGIYICTCEEGLELSGYNTELAIKTTVFASIAKEGTTVLSAKLFTDIIRKLPEDEVSVETDEGLKVYIKSGTSHFSLLSIDPTEFPELPVIEDPNTVELPAASIKSMIRQTLFAIAETDIKPIHTGTLFDIHDKKMTLVSVDGYRLALRNEPIREDVDLKFVVPGKALSELLKLIPEDMEQTVTLSVGFRHIMFSTGSYTVISSLLEGEFLDYETTIPDAYATKAQVSTREMLESVERVSLLIADRLKSPVKCRISNGNIKLSCATTIGTADDEINAQTEGDELEIGFNNKYMIDAMRNSDTDEAVLQINGPLSPIKILPKEGNSFLFLVLPVRLK